MIPILIGLCLGLIALITTIGNLIVLFAFYFDQKLRTINDYFLMNMAIADFLVGIFCIPFYIPFSVKQSWPFGHLFCKIWVTIDDVATMASVINIVAISINRYWLIAYPISYRKYIKKVFVYFVMAGIWLISFINFAPGIWLISLFKKIEENIHNCSGDYTRSFVYMLIAQFNYFIWPFILLCLLNFLIMINIWKRTRKMTRLKSCQSKRNSPHMLTNQKLSSSNFQGTNVIQASLIGPNSPTIPKKCQSNESIVDVRILQKLNHEIKKTRHLAQRDLRIKRDRKAARSLFILVLVFLIFLFPYVICSTVSTAGFHISPTILEISFWLLWLNSTCNPFLYPFIQTKYRRAYAKLFRSCFKQSI